MRKYFIISIALAYSSTAVAEVADLPYSLAAKKKKDKPAKKKGKEAAKKPAGGGSFDFGQTPAKPAPAPAPAPAASPSPAAAPAPKQPEVRPEQAAKSARAVRKRKRTRGGGQAFDFSEVATELKLDSTSPEKARFEKAMDYTIDEKWNDAAQEWVAILEDPNAQAFHREAQYQLAKTTYKIGLYNASLARFQTIIEQGEQHPRFQKSVEWLFFISRKLVDETSVLEELAQFKGVQWPRKYRNEYRYLLAKYQYLRSYELVVQAQQEAEAAKYKKAAPANAMDFGADAPVAPAGGGGFDFSSGDAAGGKQNNVGGMDFSEEGEGGQQQTVKLADVITEARKLLSQIPPASKYFPRGKYLEGLLNFLEENDQFAVDAFRQVIRLLNPRIGKQADPKLRESAFLSLARAHYGYKQYRAAAFYYSKVNRGSEQWLDSLFESSWAYFQLGDYERALGNLVTLHSPFFINEFYPESQIVKAVIYFDNCRYDETKLILKQFDSLYRPLIDAIKKFHDLNLPPDAYYAMLYNGQKDRANDKLMLNRILGLALGEQDVRRADASVREVDREIAKVKELPKALAESKYGTSTVAELQKVLKQRQVRAGTLAKAKVEREGLHLRDLLGQAYSIQFETATVEKTSLEGKLSGEQLTPENRKYAYTVATDDEKIYWPFAGEYWEDELGTYQYSLGQGCK